MLYNLLRAIVDLAEELDYLQYSKNNPETYREGSRLCLQFLADRNIRVLIIALKDIGLEAHLASVLPDIPYNIREELLSEIHYHSDIDNGAF